MSELSYEEILANSNQSGGNSDGIGFFSLKGDGAEAVVRIMCDSLEDLTILTVHPVTVQPAKFPNNRQVNCIRSARDPIELCPLCAADNKVKSKVFIKMIQYDSQGKGTPVVWDRPANVYVQTLKTYLDNYGPLSNVMCKIVRHGSGLDTTYDIIPALNPQIYNDANYPRMDNAFDNFKVLGRMVLDKNAEEMMTFISTGAFPEKKKEVSNEVPNFVPPTDSVPMGGPSIEPIPNGYVKPYTSGMSTSTSSTVMERPIRHY